MNKRSTIFIVIVGIVFLAVVLYFTPWITPVELVLDATKVDDNGNELGTVQIIMSGSKLDYLFHPSRIDVYVHPFDGITSIGPSDVHANNIVIPGMIKTFLQREFLYAPYGGVSEDGQDIIFADLGFSPDFTKWIFRDNSNHISYVASTDGSSTTRELIQYFNGLSKNSISQATQISLQTTGAEVDAKGNIIAEGEFVLKAQHQKTADNKITFELTHLELPNLKVLRPGTAVGDPAVFMSYSDHPDLLITTYSLILPHPNGKEGWEDTVIVFVYTNTDFDYFLIEYKDPQNQTHYYIGTEPGVSNYVDILQQYSLLEN